MEFQKFEKIARLSRECVITEKIDGTNAQIFILPIDKHTNIGNDFKSRDWAVIENGDFLYGVVPGSRNKWITTTKDNKGFAKWVKENAEELLKLGAGHHYGEWWGQGIARGYNMEEKVFSLFNTGRWIEVETPRLDVEDKRELCPKCCRVVPVLYRGMFETENAWWEIDKLQKNGSVAAPGFMKPEGIVIYHTASKQLFKKTIENDEKPKSIQR